ncbi:MAG: ribonuclease P protein component [Hyphomicrobiaceae bacterium]
MARLQTLRRRSEFLRVRGGRRWVMPAFIIEAKPRPPVEETGEAVEAPASSAPGGVTPRFGFTVTRKLGGAVVRNRIRRRLREAVASVASAHARDGFDYVIVAREAALRQRFAGLAGDLSLALDRIHAISPAGQARRGAGKDKARRRSRTPDARGQPGSGPGSGKD